MPGLMDLLNSLRGGMPNQVGAQSLLAPKPMLMPQMMPQQLPQQLSAPVGVNGQVPMMKNGQAASITPMMTMPQSMPDMGKMTPQAAPVQPMAKPQGLRGMLGLDQEFGGSNMTRGEMLGLALNDFGQRIGGGNGQTQLGGAMTQMVQQRGKERQAETQRQELIAQMKAAGYTPQDIVAVQFAPETTIKAIYERAAPYTLTEGQQRRDGNNQLVADAPKYAYQNDQVLRQGADGLTNLGRLNPSYENIETERNNRQQSAIGWANAANKQEPETWKTLTPQEALAANLPAGVAWQQSSRGKTEPVAPRGAIALTGADKKMLEDAREAANNARSLRAQASIFKGANQNAPSGYGADKWNFLAPETATMNQQSSLMRGSMRPPGSGATSDYEQRLYALGAPSAQNTREQNAAIIANLEKGAAISEARQFFYEDYAAQQGSLNGAERAFQKSPDFRALTQDEVLTPSGNGNFIDYDAQGNRK